MFDVFEGCWVRKGRFRVMFADSRGNDSKVYISFGGLLLLLDGPYKKLSPLRQDYVYLLMKK